MFFICLIQIPIGAAAWWICTKAIPWAIGIFVSVGLLLVEMHPQHCDSPYGLGG